MATEYHHKLKYPVHELAANECVLDKWPELRAYDDLVQYGSGDNDKWLRYAVLTCDAGSGLLRIRDLRERKIAALRSLGIRANDKRAAGAIALEDEGVQRLCLTWIKVQGNMLLGFYLMGAEMLWQDIFKLREPIEDESSTDGERAVALRGQRYDKLPARIKELQRAEYELFADDENLKRLALLEAQQEPDDESIEAVWLNQKKQ